MKKTLLITLLVIFTGSITTSVFADNAKGNKANVSVIGSNPENKDVTVKKLSDEEINCLVDRLNEIRDMDRSKLSKADKRALRKEVKDIKQTLAEQDYVIYVSLTALLLILLLIILL